MFKKCRVLLFLPLFPFADFYERSFAYFAREHLFLIFSFEILRGKLGLAKIDLACSTFDRCVEVTTHLVACCFGNRYTLRQYLTIKWSSLSMVFLICKQSEILTRKYEKSENIFVLIAGSDADENDTDAARLMSLPVLLQRSVMAPLLTQ